ncbi:mediator of DNA damage checkpoint protein 1-like isoform X1, partial [Clarias magur]
KKILKLALEKMKKKGNLGMIKQRKSDSDITQGILDRKDDFGGFESRLGTRSLSHDSIFLSEQRQRDPEPSSVLSQEYVHGRIQALQLKLQMQKMHLGPPPLVLPVKQTEDHQHPSEVLTLCKKLPHKSSSRGILPHPISPTLPPFNSSAPSPGVDFSTLPGFISCLDNSAARHRMSIKPRNQRASTKSRRMPTSDQSKFRSESMIILERPLTDSKQEDEVDVAKEMTSVCPYSSHIIRPGMILTSPPIKSPCPASPLELLVTADDDYQPHDMSQCKAKEKPSVSTNAEVGTKPILKSSEGMVAKIPSSIGPTSHKKSGDHKESLYVSSFKGVEGSDVSTVSSVYTRTEQVQAKSNKEFNTATTYIKRSAMTRNRVQDTMQEHHFQDQPLKPRSPLDSKFEDRNVNKICLLPLSGQEGCLQESTTQQRSLSFSVSSGKSHERQRTGSFTGEMEQAGGKQEYVVPLIKPLSNLKTLDPHSNTQVMTSQTGATSTPAVSAKSRDLTITMSAAQENRDSLANKTRDMTGETQEGVEEANEEMKRKEQREERSVYKVKLQNTSQLKVTVKQHNPEVGGLSEPWLPESNSPTAVGQNDSKVGSVREPYTVPRSPPFSNTELYILAESPLFSSIRPHSPRRAQERAGLMTFSDFQASAHLPGSTINVTMSMPVCVMEKIPVQTSAKESREASTELSWMTLAREKTKSLQQLFTNTLNDLAGLQTATRSAASPLTQMSKPSAESITPKHPMSSAQPRGVNPLQTQHASLRATHPTHSTNPVSSISSAQPSIAQSRGVDFSLKHSLSPMSHVQQSHLGAKPGQMSTQSATKPVQLTGIYIPPTQLASQMTAAQQQLSQMSINQADPIQQSLPQSVAKPQASQSLRLSLSPKLAHHSAHQAPLPLSQPRPLVENLSFLPLGTVDQLPMHHGKSSTESQAQYAGGLESKTFLIEQWQYQKPDAVKKSTPDYETYASLDELLTFSSHGKST